MAQMTKKERERLLARAAKLKPKPVLLPSGSWRCQVTLDGRRESVTAGTPDEAHAQALALKAGYLENKKKREEENKGNLFLKDAVDLYIKSRENVLSPSTINGYKEIRRN